MNQARLSRRVVDPINSIAWFAMDGLWLLQLAWPAYIAAGLTLITGGMLLWLNQRRGQRLDEDLALNAWMWMNSCWAISDLSGINAMKYIAMGFGGVGALLIANAFRPSRRQRDMLRRFRKMREIKR